MLSRKTSEPSKTNLDIEAGLNAGQNLNNDPRLEGGNHPSFTGHYCAGADGRAPSWRESHCALDQDAALPARPGPSPEATPPRLRPDAIQLVWLSTAPLL